MLNKVKVRITGYVTGRDGKRVTGVQEYSPEDAKRLIRLNAAVLEDGEELGDSDTDSAGDTGDQADAIAHARKVMADQSRTIDQLSAQVNELTEERDNLIKVREALEGENINLRSQLERTVNVAETEKLAAQTGSASEAEAEKNETPVQAKQTGKRAK